MSKKVITFGEIMLRLATPDYLRFCQANQFNATFGGGEANVAASLANYGIETEFVTRLPQNDIARACVMELRKQGIGTSKIIYGGERLGIYFLETGAVARASKVVYDRAHSSIAEIRPGMIDWDEVFKDASWFHWTGITPVSYTHLVVVLTNRHCYSAANDFVQKVRMKPLPPPVRSPIVVT